MEMFNSDTDFNNIDPDTVIGRGAIFTCVKCGAQAPSIIFEDVTPPLPEGWCALKERDINGQQGYLCPDCWKEGNKPFSYSIEINGELVQPPKTITPFKDKGGD